MEWDLLALDAVQDVTGGTLNTTSTHDPFVETSWIKGATLWMNSSSIHQSASSEETTYYNLINSRHPIDDLDTSIRELTRIRGRDTTNSTKGYIGFDRRNYQTTSVFDGPGVVVFANGGEGIWTALGRLALANQNYITLSEHLTRKVGGTTAYPDGAAFRLGALQEVLAKIGIAPGGATLAEIAIRSCYGEFSSSDVTVGERVTVIEGKSDDKGADGARELSSHRRNGKEPYLASNGVDGGWLVCPQDRGRLSRLDDIGAVTWDKDGFWMVDAPQMEVNSEARAELLRRVKMLVLDQVLRYQSFECALTTAVQQCLGDPEMLYHYID